MVGCPQICNLPPGNCPSYGISEDCLYLSIFSPTFPSQDKDGYPVMIWIHGGAFTQGLGNCALYNGSTFAQKDVISVVINYRLGALGFMASPSMEGNYGIADQRAAMRWVVDNIAGFGGNPQAITLAGQSAGAMSLSVHLVSSKSKGLFQRGKSLHFSFAVLRSKNFTFVIRHNGKQSVGSSLPHSRLCNCQCRRGVCLFGLRCG